MADRCWRTREVEAVAAVPDVIPGRSLPKLAPLTARLTVRYCNLHTYPDADLTPCLLTQGSPWRWRTKDVGNP